MKGNAWLAGFLVFAVVLIGGAGFFFTKGLGAYNEAFNGWDRLSSKIERLEKEVPYPSKENEDDLSKVVQGYGEDVNALYESLARYQKPLNQQLSDSEFTTQLLPGKVSGVMELARENEFVVDQPEEFNLAMEDYRATFPKPEMVPMLDYQLGAIDHLVRQLIGSGVDRLRYVTREQLPGEADSGGEEESGVVEGQVVQKYPISMRFEANHASFQKFVNAIANDKDYFFILRLLRVENSSPDGPSFAEGGNQGPTFVNAEGVEAAQELIDATGSTTATMEELVTAMAEQGYQLQSQDARIIFGQEKLDVFAVIDLVRFLPPDAAAEGADSGADERKGNPRNR